MNDQQTGEVKLHFMDYWRVVRIRLPLIILVFLLVVITAGVVTYFMPRQYASSVTMQIKQNDTYMRVFDDRGGGGAGLTRGSSLPSLKSSSARKSFTRLSSRSDWSKSGRNSTA